METQKKTGALVKNHIQTYPLMNSCEYISYSMKPQNVPSVWFLYCWSTALSSTILYTDICCVLKIFGHADKIKLWKGVKANQKQPKVHYDTKHFWTFEHFLTHVTLTMIHTTISVNQKSFELWKEDAMEMLFPCDSKHHETLAWEELLDVRMG